MLHWLFPFVNRTHLLRIAGTVERVSGSEINGIQGRYFICPTIILLFCFVSLNLDE